MRLRVFLVVANLCAWAILVALRPPLPDAHFAERDAVRLRGEFLVSSSDPLLVIAGRPLWQWSTVHGGEWTIVKLLEVANVVPLGAIILVDVIVGSGTRVRAYTRSVFAFGGLLLFTSGQWWIAGSSVSWFRAWRQQRHREAA